MTRGSSANRNLDRYLGIPILFVASRVAGMLGGRVRPSAFNRIGVACGWALGDTLLASAVIQDIRRWAPCGRIIFFASPSNAAAARLLPCVDEIVTREPTSPKQYLAGLRSAQLDILFDFSPWQRLAALYALFSKAKYRVGFDSENQYRRWGYDLTVEHSKELHELDNTRRLIQSFGIETRSEPQLRVLDTDIAIAEVSTRLIVFHPWSSSATGLKDWPLNRWVELAVHLSAQENTLFVITGSKRDAPRSETVCRRFREAGLKAKEFVGDDGLLSLSHLLRKASLMVSVNTGIMHLSAILGTPTIGLDGPTPGRRWGPRGQFAVSVSPEGEGCGYLHFGFEYAGNAKDCMARISVEQVLRSSLAVMSEHASVQKLSNVK